MLDCSCNLFWKCSNSYDYLKQELFPWDLDTGKTAKLLTHPNFKGAKPRIFFRTVNTTWQEESKFVTCSFQSKCESW